MQMAGILAWVASHDWITPPALLFLLGMALALVNALIAGKTGKDSVFFGRISLVPFAGFFVFLLLVASRNEKAPLRTFFKGVLHDPFELTYYITGTLLFLLWIVSDMTGSGDTVGYVCVAGAAALTTAGWIRNRLVRKKNRKLQRAAEIMNESAKKSGLN